MAVDPDLNENSVRFGQKMERICGFAYPIHPLMHPLRVEFMYTLRG